MDLEKTLLRKVGEAVTRFKMIRDGDRVAVALSGGKDSLTMLEALVLLRDRAPIEFTVLADWFLRRRGIREKTRLTLATPLDGCFTKPVASKHLTHLLEERVS